MAQTKGLYDILLDALCCMMVADDEVSATEKATIVGVLEECEGPHSAEDVNKSIESFRNNLAERGFASILEATLESARAFQKQDKQKVILSALTIVAKADGVIDDTEREVFASFKRVLQRIEVKKNLLGRLIISYDCPKCTERLNSPIREGGETDFCPNCHAQFTVPLPEEVAVEAPARYQTSVFNKDTSFLRGIFPATGKFIASCFLWIVNNQLYIDYPDDDEEWGPFRKFHFYCPSLGAACVLGAFVFYSTIGCCLYFVDCTYTWNSNWPWHPYLTIVSSLLGLVVGFCISAAISFPLVMIKATRLILGYGLFFCIIELFSGDHFGLGEKLQEIFNRYF